MLQVHAVQHVAGAVPGVQAARVFEDRLSCRCISMPAQVGGLHLAAGAHRLGVSLAMTAPLTITVMRSAMRNTASMSCSTSRMAWPAFSSASSSSMRSVSSAPMPASGSSSSSTCGAVARHMAISSWRFWPWRQQAGLRARAAHRPGRRARRLARRAMLASQAARLCHQAQGRCVRACAARRQFSSTLKLGVDGVALVAAAQAGARAPRLRPGGDVLPQQLAPAAEAGSRPTGC
jgi:hypothetical protein